MTLEVFNAEDLRRVVVEVLAAHLAELVESLGGDRWPRLSPHDALTDLAVGECSILDHVDAIVARIMSTRSAELGDDRRH